MEKEEFIHMLEAIIETAIDGIININDRGIIEKLNSAAAKLFEYKKEELLGQNVKILMNPPDKEAHDDHLKRYLRTKEPHIIGIGREVIGRKKSGESFPFRLAVSEVVLNDRIMFTGVIHDLTDVRKAQNELKRTNENLEEIVTERTYQLENVANKLLKKEKDLRKALEKEKELGSLKSRFVSMASHEFRTPLASILSSASLISKYEKAEEQEKRAKHIDRIKSSVSSLTGILNDFLSLNKLEENKVEAIYESIPLDNLFMEITRDCKIMLKSDKVLKVTPVGMPKEFVSDRRIVKNILFNLISNAIKYSYENTTIEITYSFLKEHLSISVKNYGIGIPNDDQKHLFTRFFRAKNVENIQGTGLGLSIVLQYLDILSGHISFESIPEKETVFTVNIPYQKSRN